MLQRALGCTPARLVLLKLHKRRLDRPAYQPEQSSKFFAILLLAGTGIFFIWDFTDRTARYRGQLKRAEAVQELVTIALDPKRPALTVPGQLQEWLSNDDVVVFAQYQREGFISFTYQGRLILQDKGVGGYVFYAPDWHLGPLDSVSVIRGIALNLHHWTSYDWRPGNGKFGSRCHFERRGTVAMRGARGEAIVNDVIVETLNLMIDDPFETMHFLE